MQRDSDSNVLKAIKDNNMIFVSAQPDQIYFHWQVEIYLYQFAKHGIIDRCYALIGFTGSSPSEYAKKLAQKYPTVKLYKDTRSSKANTYIPSIRPHLLAKFFKEYPELGKNVFYHDSDIFLVKLPRFDQMLGLDNNTSYVSDTISYIGYEYIKSCSQRYKDKHKYLRDLDVFYGMCDVIGIDYNLVIANEKNSGGAQYLLKNIDAAFWLQVEIKCLELYDYLSNYEKKYPVNHHIQKWTTDMWVVLWLYWMRGGKTLIHKELDFSWATSNVADYKRLNIFHLAGITGTNCNDKFYKGRYTKQTIFDAYILNPKIFDHISPNNATYEYVAVIKEYINNVYLQEKKIERSLNMDNPYAVIKGNVRFDNTHADINDGLIFPQNVKQFRLNVKNRLYSGVYTVDESKQCCGKPIWRLDNRSFIIFWSGSNWILTHGRYENQISSRCGGIVSTSADQPYHGDWNIESSIDIL